MEVDQFLEHVGVKGMKWGVRSKSPSPRKSLPPSGDFKKTAELRKRKKSQLTDKQLNTVNSRLQRENTFSKLNPSTIAKGHGLAKAILAGGALGAGLFKFTQTPAGKKLISEGSKYVKVAVKTSYVNKGKINTGAFKSNKQMRLFK